MPPFAELKNVLNLGRLYLSLSWSRLLRRGPGQVAIVHLAMTDRCNSRCAACDIWQPRWAAGAELTMREILGLIPALKRLKTRIVSLGGGEPTLRDDLEECIRALHEAGMAVHMNTNGLAVTAQRAASLVNAGLGLVRISCDHVTPEGYKAIRGVDGYDRAVEAMRFFRQGPRPLCVGVNVVVTRLNQDVIEAFADRAAAWGVQKLQFIPVHAHLQHRNMDAATFEPLTPLTADLPAIKDALRRATRRLRAAGIETNSRYHIEHFDAAYQPRRVVPCVSGRLSVIVSAFGEVQPCYQYPTGLNVRDMPLDRIVHSEGFRGACGCVSRCRLPCWDVGPAEPSIRLHLPHLLAHPLRTWRDARLAASTPRR
ncbi:MAG: radical SAM protein [Planctomycetaceae bacterium]